jgi:hypothetical protein
MGGARCERLDAISAGGKLKDCHAETNFAQLNRSTIPIRRRPFGAAAYRHAQTGCVCGGNPDHE